MTPEQRQAWLAERRTGIGGSDAAAAVGLSKWKTPLELWMDKLGQLPDRQTEPMRWGTILEPVILQEYANQTGRSIEIPGRIIRHQKVSFAILTADGIANGTRLVEGKTARSDDGWGEPGSADIPQEYLFQVQHGLFVTGLKVCDVPVLIGGSDFRIYVVPADREMQDLLMEQEAAFWKLVKAKTPPAPVNREDVKRRWNIAKGTKCTVGAAEVEQAITLMRAKALAKYLKEEVIDELSAGLQAKMQEASELVGPDGQTVATWNNVNGSPWFDVDRFKAEHPKLFAKYLNEPSPQRRFLLKLKGSDQWSPEQMNQLLSSQNPPKIAGSVETEPSPSARKASAPSPSNKGSRRKSKVA